MTKPLNYSMIVSLYMDLVFLCFYSFIYILVFYFVCIFLAGADCGE